MTKVRVLLLFLGALGGYGSWKLSQQARFYCGSYAGEQFFDAEPLLSIAAGIMLALVCLLCLPSKPDASWRLTAAFALLLLLLAVMSWVQFAWLGTPAGGTSDSGRCASSNVPAWWPGWLPT